MLKEKNIPSICFPFSGDVVDDASLSTIEIIRKIDRLRYKPEVLIHREGPLTRVLRKKRMDYEIMHLPYMFNETKPVSDTSSGKVPYGKPVSGRMENLKGFLKSTWAIMRFLAEKKYKIIHTTDDRLNPLWAVPSILAKRKLLWHQYTMFPPTGYSRVTAGYAQKIICPSFFAKKILNDRLFAYTDIVFPAFDEKLPFSRQKDARKKIYKELKIKDDVKVAVFIDSDFLRKEIDLILRTAKKINEEIKTVFIFSGNFDDSFWKELKEKAKEYEIERQIRKTGIRIPAEPFIASCDLFIGTEITGSFDFNIVRAMLTGTPVIAIDKGANGEILTNEETGFLIEDDFEDRISKNAIELLKSEEKSEKIAKAAREWAVKYCGNEKQTETIMEIYDSILKGN